MFQFGEYKQFVSCKIALQQWIVHVKPELSRVIDVHSFSWF
jgi:hypothetical protein